MKKHNTLKVVLITMFVFAILTWIIPAAYFQNEVVDQGRVQIGLFDLFNYPLTALSYFGYISLYVLIVGGFYGILYKIPAYRNLLDRLSFKLKKHSLIFLVFVILILAGLTSLCGSHIELIIFFPFIISLMLMVGYDKITAAMTIVGSCMVGIAGTTYGYSTVNLVISNLGLAIDSMLLWKLVILFAGIVLLILNILSYIKKSNLVVASSVGSSKLSFDYDEDDEDDEDDEEEYEEEKVDNKVKINKTNKNSNNNKNSSKKNSSSKNTNSRNNSTSKNASSSRSKKTSNTRKSNTRKNNHSFAKTSSVVRIDSFNSDNNEYIPSEINDKHKIWPLVVVFVFLCILSVLAFIPWATAFKSSVFTNATSSVSGFKIFDFPLFGKLLGTVNSFGSWSITDMFLPMFICILFLVLVYKIKFNDLFDGFENGLKKSIMPALVILLIYAILVLVTYHPFQLTIYKLLLGKKFNVFSTSLVTLLASIFNSDATYVFNSYLPFLASFEYSKAALRICALIGQSIYGVSMLVLPTSAILMGVLTYLKVSYFDWLKTVWKLFLELFVILLILFVILAAI